MNAVPGYTLPSIKYKQKATVATVVALVFVGLCVAMGFDPALLFTEFHYVRDLAVSMTPPNFKVFWSDASIYTAIAESLCMAFLGTLLGGLGGLVLAFLSASSTMPFKGIRMVCRGVLTLLRVIPALILILIFVVSVGIGPFSGVLTLLLATVGSFGQLFTQVLEQADPKPLEAVYSVGASRVQVIRFGLWPQVLPSFIANMFYAYDVNLRAGIGLGIFGGGGVGFQLFMAIRLLHYKEAFALICVTVVLILLMEKVSDLLRVSLLQKNL
jgi:phosphonate transport system permease protein